MSDSRPQDPSPPQRHRAEAPESVLCAVITVSDTRVEADDASGRTIVQLLEAAGHRIELYRIVKDDADEIRAAIDQAVQAGVQAIVTSGGTGIASRDGTYEVLASMLEKRLDGFGEIFRMISYSEIGAAAMLSRALAGAYRGVAIFSLPGSTAAAQLAMEKLIVPELGHVVGQLAR